MMKHLYLISTSLFGAALLAFWGAAIVAGGGTSGESAANDGNPPISGAELSSSPGRPRFTLAQVAAHAKPSDCWMAMNGAVFDVSTYVPQHPAPPSVIADWCGREATQAFETKNRGRPHSPYARQLLEQYRIGILDATALPGEPGSR